MEREQRLLYWTPLWQKATPWSVTLWYLKKCYSGNCCNRSLDRLSPKIVTIEIGRLARYCQIANERTRRDLRNPTIVRSQRLSVGTELSKSSKVKTRERCVFKLKAKIEKHGRIFSDGSCHTYTGDLTARWNRTRTGARTASAHVISGEGQVGHGHGRGSPTLLRTLCLFVCLFCFCCNHCWYLRV